MNKVKIDPNKLYRPREIVNNAWIVNTMGNPDYDYVLKLIRKGALKAADVSLGGEDSKRYQVVGQEIIDFRKKLGYVD